MTNPRPHAPNSARIRQQAACDQIMTAIIWTKTAAACASAALALIQTENGIMEQWPAAVDHPAVEILRELGERMMEAMYKAEAAAGIGSDDGNETDQQNTADA